MTFTELGSATTSKALKMGVSLRCKHVVVGVVPCQIKGSHGFGNSITQFKAFITDYDLAP